MQGNGNAHPQAAGQARASVIPVLPPVTASATPPTAPPATSSAKPTTATSAPALHFPSIPSSDAVLCVPSLPASAPPLPIYAPEPARSGQATSSTPSSIPLSSPLDAVDPTAKNKRGRKSAFTPEQDIMILREVAAKKAHIADYGQKGKKFELVKDSLVATGRFKDDIEGKNIQDRYNRLQKDFNNDDPKVSKMSGVGGEVTEAEELLSAMREASDDLKEMKEAEKEKVKAVEERKLAAGRRIIEMASKRKGRRNRVSDGGSDRVEDGEGENEEESGGREGSARVISSSEEGDEEGDELRRKKRKKGGRVKHDLQLGLDLETFGQSIHASDLEIRNMEQEKIAVEKERLRFGREEREKDRLERRAEIERQSRERRDELELERQMRKEEREAQNKLELDKFKMMMDMFNRKLDKQQKACCKGSTT